MNKQEVIELYSHLINSYHFLSPKIKKVDDNGFGFIPSDISILEEVIDEIERDVIENKFKSDLAAYYHAKDGFNFIDFGCGIPIFAYCIKRAFSNFHVYGLELNKDICDYIKKTPIGNEIGMIKKDALLYTKYDKYTYLYMYTPLIEAEPMNQLLMYVLKNMKKDSILFLNRTNAYPLIDYIDEIEKVAEIKNFESDSYLHKITKK